jgi:glutathione S-transferase
MAIGKDVYCDSRLIICALESLYPGSLLTPSSPTDVGILKLLQSWTIDGGIFFNAVKMMPYWTSNSVLHNKAFVDDRERLMGKRMTVEGMQTNRPDGLQHLRQALELLETTFLVDGRDWILGTDYVTLADIDAVWPFAWLIADPSMKGSLPAEYAGEHNFPKVFAYVRRFMAEVDRKKSQAPKWRTLNGNAMRKAICGASSEHQPTKVSQNDPLQLQHGEEVEVFASDYGSAHKDHGYLVGLTLTEVVIRNAKGLHLHFPRWNFRINKLKPTLLLSSSAVQSLAKL